MKIAILCGGPSLERGISLNSARSVCDHLQSDEIEIVPIYFDQKKKPFHISRAQLYSNTPSDFDFKLASTAKPLSASGLLRLLKSVDLTFPVMHGPFGEDGEIQRYLQKNKLPFVGSPEAACKLAFDKHRANDFIRENGFFAPPSIVLKSHLNEHASLIKDFFKREKLQRVIVKPATGGSSIAVYSVSTPEEALQKAHEIFSKRVDTRVVVEPFCEGIEFTVIILQNRFGLPVAVMPSEIELNYADHQIFDYRKKYLATRQVTYHCPPRFSNEVIEKIQIQAEQLFTLLGMQDFARFDGWLLPDGNLWFSDFNPISGMEQNSFLFMQAARIGMSHSDVLNYIVRSACRRNKILEWLAVSDQRSVERLPALFEPEPQSRRPSSQLPAKKKISVLFGGDTAERQVSVMSGTNVWLKLRKSEKYEPTPFLLDTHHHVWRLPYALTLNHTVEEIMETCESARNDEARLADLIRRVATKLSVKEGELSEPWFLPEKMTLKQFIQQSDFVFIGLHGGIGENGELQKMLEKAKKPFNGSGSETSRLCMDKYKTGQVIQNLREQGIYTAEKKLEKRSVFDGFKPLDYKHYWKELTQLLGSKTVIVKPVGDGCSAGIARLFSPEDLKSYLTHVKKKAPFIAPGTLTEQHGVIEMPTNTMKELLFEQFIITDKIRVIGNRLKWEEKTNWIEITMGIVQRRAESGERRAKLQKRSTLHAPRSPLAAMAPSLTVALGNVLSLEEKFQGGTGVNITPPPQPFVKKSAIQKAQKRMELVAKALGIRGYARIDAFMHRHTGELIIIEANTTPGLTPSTVIYHQALEEKPPLYPTQFLETIISNSQ